MSDKEIELKIQIKNKALIIKKLKSLGATFVAKRTQDDILYNSNYYDFADYDQVLRLRMEKSGKGEFAQLAFKGTPKHTKNGLKVRDEFETKIENTSSIRKIITSIGFRQVDIIRKVRESYKLNNLNIEIDTLKFGTFIEIEGKPKDIEKLRRELGLENEESVKLGYGRLQLAWEKKKK